MSIISCASISGRNSSRFIRAAWLTLNDSRILELFANATRLDLPAAPGSDIVEALFREHVDPARAA